MGTQRQESFREFVAGRSSALLKTAVLLSGGDRHAAQDLLQNAQIKDAGRWHRIDEPEAYVRQVLYRQQVSRGASHGGGARSASPNRRKRAPRGTGRPPRSCAW